jgi:hypothetical protein
MKEGQKIGLELEQYGVSNRTVCKVLGLSESSLSSFINGRCGYPPDVVRRLNCLCHMLLMIRTEHGDVPIDLNAADWLRKRIAAMDASIVAAPSKRGRARLVRRAKMAATCAN